MQESKIFDIYMHIMTFMRPSWWSELPCGNWVGVGRYDKHVAFQLFVWKRGLLIEGLSKGERLINDTYSQTTLVVPLIAYHICMYDM